eukprot:UN26286
MGGKNSVTNLHATTLEVETGSTTQLTLSNTGGQGFVHVSGGTVTGGTEDSSCSGDTANRKHNWTSTPTFSYVAPDTAGSYTMTIATASNNSNGVDTQEVTITVTDGISTCAECVAASRSWQIGQCNPTATCDVPDTSCYEDSDGCDQYNR